MAKKARKTIPAFERWMDKQRPWWRKWTDDERAACTPVAVAQFMREAWNAATAEAEKRCVAELVDDTSTAALRYNEAVRDCLRAIKKAGNV